MCKALCQILSHGACVAAKVPCDALSFREQWSRQPHNAAAVHRNEMMDRGAPAPHPTPVDKALAAVPLGLVTERDVRVIERLKRRSEVGSKGETTFYRQASGKCQLPCMRNGVVVWKTARKINRVKDKVSTFVSKKVGVQRAGVSPRTFKGFFAGPKGRDASREALRLECAGAFDDPNTPKAAPSPRPRWSRTNRRPRAYAVGGGRVVHI